MSDERPQPVDELLAARGASKRWLARKLAMNETLLSHYLAGRRDAPADLYQRIADVLHVPTSFLTPLPKASRPAEEAAPV